MTDLLTESGPVYRPTLATYVGDSEALLLSQIGFILRDAKDKPNIGKEADGRLWYRLTPAELVEKHFPSWSESKAKRVLANLRQDALLLARYDLNAWHKDRTLWYTIDDGALASLAGPVERVQARTKKRRQASQAAKELREARQLLVQVDEFLEQALESEAEPAAQLAPKTEGDDYPKVHNELSRNNGAAGAAPGPAEATLESPQWTIDPGSKWTNGKVHNGPTPKDNQPKDNIPKEESSPDGDGAEAPEPEHKVWFAAVCAECFWDWKLITDAQRGQVNQTWKILQKAGYKPEQLAGFGRWFDGHKPWKYRDSTVAPKHMRELLPLFLRWRQDNDIPEVEVSQAEPEPEWLVKLRRVQDELSGQMTKAMYNQIVRPWQPQGEPNGVTTVTVPAAAAEWLSDNRIKPLIEQAVANAGLPPLEFIPVE